jgi:anti-sigma regulatory factor (Ser/Thr protein kinase)
MSLNKMSSHDAILEFRVPSQPHLSRVVRDAVADFARSHDVSGDTLSHFLSALGEALANAIEHARSEQPIEVEIRIGAGHITGVVRDRGIGFAAERAANPTLPDPHSERGRGLPIMRRCCEIFSIESAPGRGTCVHIGCRVESAKAAVLTDPTHAA